MACKGCKEATIVVDRFCITDWQSITIDATTDPITKDMPIGTNVVTFPASTYSAGGTVRVHWIELEETCTGSDTNIVRPNARVLLFDSFVAPTAPVAGVAYVPDLTKLAVAGLIAGTDATASINTGWWRPGAMQRRGLIRLEHEMTLEDVGQDIRAVILAEGASSINYVGKGTAMRIRLGLELLS